MSFFELLQMKLFFRASTIIVFLCLLQCQTSFADTVFTHDGASLNGTVVKIDSGIVKLWTGERFIELNAGDIHTLSISVPLRFMLDSAREFEGYLRVTSGHWFIQKDHDVEQVNYRSIFTINDTTHITSLSEQHLQLIAARGSKTGKSGNGIEEKLSASEASFLRTDSILLKDHQVEAEFDFSYLRNHQMLIDDRVLRLDMIIRTSVTNNIEGYIRTPVFFASRSYPVASTLISNNELGAGDVGVGFKMKVHNQSSSFPELILRTGLTLPTGRHQYRGNFSQFAAVKDPINPFFFPMGSGHVSASLGLNIIRTIDPVVLFGGCGFSYSFAKNYYQFKVKPGSRFNISSGVGFVISEKSSISQSFQAEYVQPYKSNGSNIGHSAAPITLRLAYTHRFNDWSVFEPSVQLGLTNDASNAVLSFAYTFRFN